MAAFGSTREMISKLNIQVINLNLSSERPRAIAANHKTKKDVKNNRE